MVVMPLLDDWALLQAAAVAYGAADAVDAVVVGMNER